MIDWCPSREKVLVVRVRRSSAFGFILLPFNVFADFNKNVDDMFIPFAHDPDLGSTVTSFHASVRIKVDSRDRPRLAGTSQGAQAKVLHLCLEKTNRIYYGIIGNLLSWRSLCKLCRKFI